MSKGELILYQTEDGFSEIQLRAIDGTVWLSQDEIAQLFDKVAQPLPNIFRIFLKMENYRKIQFVGISDELPTMAKIMAFCATIWI